MEIFVVVGFVVVVIGAFVAVSLKNKQNQKDNNTGNVSDDDTTVERGIFVRWKSED